MGILYTHMTYKNLGDDFGLPEGFKKEGEEAGNEKDKGGLEN